MSRVPSSTGAGAGGGTGSAGGGGGKKPKVARAVEIERLEIFLQRSPDHLPSLCQLSELYLLENRITKATPYIKKAVKLFKDSQLTVSQGLQVTDILLLYWKIDRFVNKGNTRVNVSLERKKKLSDTHEVVGIIHKMRDPQLQQLIAFKYAYVKENLGNFQDALTLFSDLITQQAMEQVDLSFIIFKAAAILKHLGESKQAIEYLEFLQDDPPSAEQQHGYSKLHIIAFLILTYEQAGDKYRVFLPKAYKDLAKVFEEPDELQSTNPSSRPTTSSTIQQNKKLEELVKHRNVMQSSELWEILAFQALDRCEYVIAAEFLLQATLKAPNKGPLIHCLMEVLYLLGEKDAAGKLGDRAMVLLPSNGDLRNLLLQIDPDKWADRLRFIAPTSTDREPSPAKNGRITSPDKAASSAPSSVPTASAASAPLPDENHPPATTANAAADGKAKHDKRDKKDKKGQAKSTTAANQDKKESGGLFSKLKRVSSEVFQKPSQINKNKKDEESAAETKVDEEAPELPKKKSLKDIKQEIAQELADAKDQAKRPATSHGDDGRVGKPKKPEISAESKRMLNLALQGNTNIHFHDPTLAALADIKRRYGKTSS